MTPAEIVARLSPAERLRMHQSETAGLLPPGARKALLWLPENGSRLGSEADIEVWPWLPLLYERGLAERAGNEWALSNDGAAVRALLPQGETT